MDRPHIPHSHGTCHLIGAVGAQSSFSPLPSLGSPSSFVSNVPKYHLQHIAGFHSHTHPTHTVACQRPKPPHASNGSGGTKLGRKNAGELLRLIKIRHSLRRREATKGRARRRCRVLMLQCVVTQRLCLVSVRGETYLRSKHSIHSALSGPSSAWLWQDRKTK